MVIDFVLDWVDGNDPAFIAKKSEYTGVVKQDNEANGECRYRSETEILRYWFRGVERFAPWVHKIFFVTCGQKPEWLDENHPKLVWVDHRDFIPEKYLPTFNARTIEMNYHRIKGLAEHFVLFNDDIFLLQPVSSSLFFKDGNPVLATDLRYPKRLKSKNWSRVLFNDYCLVNRSFNIQKSIWTHRRKWFNIMELGLKRTRQNLICYLANKSLPVTNYGHVALPHLKSTLKEIWDSEGEILDAACKQKFRSDNQVNQWLCCAWNQAKGCFYPVHEDRLGIRVIISPNSLGQISKLIRNQSIPQICVNDTSSNTDYLEYCEKVLSAFSVILPERSSFELF